MLPKVVIYNAVSLDGSIGLKTADLAIFYGLASIWKEDATLVGTETILKGLEKVEPERPGDLKTWKVDPKDKRPLLVVPDSRGRIRCWHMLRRSGYWRDVVALCSRSTPVKYIEYLRKRHIGCIIAGPKKVDLRAALGALRSEFGVRSVRVDSGGVLNGLLLRLGLVSEVSLLVHPELVGGNRPKTFYLGPALPEGQSTFKLFRMQKVKGGLVWLGYRVMTSRRVG